MSAVQQAERAARRYVDSAHFLLETAALATKAAELIEGALEDAVKTLTPGDVDDLLRALDGDLPAVLAVLAALEET
jgi:hypothetical protein